MYSCLNERRKDSCEPQMSHNFDYAVMRQNIRQLKTRLLINCLNDSQISYYVLIELCRASVWVEVCVNNACKLYMKRKRRGYNLR